MALKKYVTKRAFNLTPEPKGKVSLFSKEEPLHFCIQKHAASHLHYDLRLEHEGVLLSWAVPKEPSNDTSVKRLAIMVEDHPLEYRHFEGVIPKGNYGAGTVKIWDEGTYVVTGTATRDDSEMQLSKGLKKGHIDFTLFGSRLKGDFSLIKLKNAENNWLMIKRKDHPQEMPREIKPMLATLVKEPFDNDEWLFETKWDGYRVLAYMDEPKVELRSRNALSFNQLFAPIVEDLKNIKAQVIFDGEVVILDANGVSNFQLLQNYRNTKKGTLYYFVFDILYLNGRDLRELPLIERKELLKSLLDSSSCAQVRYSDHIENRGIAFFKEAQKVHLEGIMGKKKDSHYYSRRAHSWVKIKTHAGQEAVIAGFTAPRGSREKFGSLLLGVYDNEKRLVYIGHVGGGFDQKKLNEIYALLEPLKQEACPFKNKPKTNTSATWVKPKLVCEIKFAEWTSDGLMRQPIFQGLRMDKNALEVKKEVEQPVEAEEKLKRKTKSKVVNLSKVYWPDEGYTKDDLVQYYEAIGPYILPYLENRPVMLHRYPEGITGQSFYQKDVSKLHLPDYIATKRIVHEEKPVKYMVINNLDALIYAINLGAIEIHPFFSQVENLDNPVYMVIDLDPEDISFEEVIDVAQMVHDILDAMKVKSYCKTSGGRGLHICIPLASRYTFEQAKRFGELIAAMTHEQIPSITSLKRKPKERQQRVYLDVYQNNKGQTLVPPYCARARPGATVSTPLKWSEVKSGLNPKQFTIKTVVERVKKAGDLFKPVLGKGIDIEAAINKL